MSTPPAPKARRGRPPSGGRAAILAATKDLLQERGASRLTTREVARRAGVSEGSVFYHFTDRLGLLTAVIEEGLTALGPMKSGAADTGSTASLLDQFTSLIETFLCGSMPAMIAAQSDSELRAALVDHLLRNDMGPHRGIQMLTGYLRAAQQAGTVRDDVDAAALASLVYGSSFERVAQRLMISPDYGTDMPSRQDIVAALDILLAP
jgi:AcrR family transcriptional regulator